VLVPEYSKIGALLDFTDFLVFAGFDLGVAPDGDDGLLDGILIDAGLDKNEESCC
jgi:hypothetical protein